MTNNLFLNTRRVLIKTVSDNRRNYPKIKPVSIVQSDNDQNHTAMRSRRNIEQNFWSIDKKGLESGVKFYSDKQTKTFRVTDDVAVQNNVTFWSEVFSAKFNRTMRFTIKSPVEVTKSFRSISLSLYILKINLPNVFLEQKSFQ